MRNILLLLASLALCQGFTVHPDLAISTRSALTRTTALRAGESEDGGEKPFAVVVQATIEPDRMAEFLKLIQTNAEETRKEPGCIRFDVLRSQESPNEFFFYELYKGPSAIDYHKVRSGIATRMDAACAVVCTYPCSVMHLQKQPHYNLWADFKATGGVIETITYKTDAEFLTT